MVRYDFTRQAERIFLKLPSNLRKRILQKVEYYLSQPNPLIYADRLAGTQTPTFRFRVGDYRVIFDWEGESILILSVGHRREIYRG